MKLKDRRSKKELMREVEQLRGIIVAVAQRLGGLGKFTVAALLLRAEEGGKLLADRDRARRPESAPVAEPMTTVQTRG